MTLSAVHKRRLLKLAAYLDTVAPEHFDMSDWITSHTGGEVYVGKPRCELDEEDRVFRTPEAALADCGTAACVAGHAAGLFKLRPEDTYYGWGAEAAKYLGLEYGPITSAGNRLFLPSDMRNSRRTPDLAAQAIRELVVTGEVPLWWWEAREIVAARETAGAGNV